MDNRKWIVTAISVCIVSILLLGSVAGATGNSSLTQTRPDDYALYDDFSDASNWTTGTAVNSQLVLNGSSSRPTNFQQAGPGNGDFTLEGTITLGDSRSFVALENDAQNRFVSVEYNIGDGKVYLSENDGSFSETSMSLNMSSGETFGFELRYRTDTNAYKFETGGKSVSIGAGTASWGDGTIRLQDGGSTVQNQYTTKYDWIGYRQNINLPASVTGTVKDSRGSGIKGAKVTLTNRTNASESYNTTTATNGGYTIQVPAGNYRINASHPDYIGQSKTVNVTSGEETTVNFILDGINDALYFDAPAYMEHGSRDKYSASGKVDGDWKNITDKITVTSSNPNVILVDTASNELVATPDQSVAERVTLTISWTTPDGETLNTKHNVTVANETVSNIDILPPTQKFAAVIGGGTYPAIFLATALASAVSLIATVTAGLAIMPVVLFAAMIVGFVEIQVVIAATLVCIFMGLNIGQNIDYGVR